MKLKLDNPSMRLCALSMRKVFHILAIAGDCQHNNSDFIKQNLVAVSQLPAQPRMNLLANCYAPKFPSRLLRDLSTHEKPYTNLYIQSEEQYFQIAYVSGDRNYCNSVCLERGDITLIATDNEGRHYLASKTPVKIHSKE